MCQNPKPLWLENGKISDAQITASSEWNPNHGATNARLNFQAHEGKTGAWSARSNDMNQWLQVDFRQQAEVTGIRTQGRGNCGCNQWVKSYTISYSNDGCTFYSYRQNGNIKVMDCVIFFFSFLILFMLKKLCQVHWSNVVIAIYHKKVIFYLL